MTHPEDAPLISLTGVEKSFGSSLVLGGINLSLYSGQALVLLGPNGGGKTTLLRLASGLLRPSRGKACLDSRPAHRVLRKGHLPIGFLPEFPSLYSNLTVQENLAFFGRLMALRGDQLRERTEYLLSRFGLGSSLKKPIKLLSKGTQYKVSLCRALMNNPRVLFLDEPSTGLSPEVVRFIEDYLLEEKRKGLTILFTSHNLRFALALADRYAVIDRRVLRAGHVEDIGGQQGNEVWRVGVTGLDEMLVERLRSIHGIRVLSWSLEELVFSSEGADPTPANDVLRILLQGDQVIRSLNMDSDITLDTLIADLIAEGE